MKFRERQSAEVKRSLSASPSSSSDNDSALTNRPSSSPRHLTHWWRHPIVPILLGIATSLTIDFLVHSRRPMISVQNNSHNELASFGMPHRDMEWDRRRRQRHSPKIDDLLSQRTPPISFRGLERPQDAAAGDDIPRNPEFPESAARNTNITAKARSFYNRHCALNQPHLHWWPENNNTMNWRLRTPALIIMGDFGITRAFEKALLATNQFTSTKQMAFFLPWNLPSRYWRDAPWNKVHVGAIRQHLWYSEKYFSVPSTDSSQIKMAVDQTPNYFVFSSTTRIPMFCTFPWVKLLIILRNPLERLVGEYELWIRNPQNAQVSLEQAIEMDLQRLVQYGVLVQANSTTSNYDQTTLLPQTDRDQERVAWNRYLQSISHEQAFVARSLYVIAMEDWMDALRDMQRNPATELRIIRREALVQDKNHHYQQVQQWLQDYPPGMITYPSSSLSLSPRDMTLGNAPLGATSGDRNLMGKLSAQTRQRLDSLLEHYNQRLYRLLEWPKEWEWQ